MQKKPKKKKGIEPRQQRTQELTDLLFGTSMVTSGLGVDDSLPPSRL